MNRKKIGIFLLSLLLLFSGAFDLIYTPEEEGQETPGEEAGDTDGGASDEEAIQWIDINEDQAEILTRIYDEMTPAGQQYSGWFTGEDHAPCTWRGISCENGKVSGLNFENAGYFTTFPESVTDLHDLKELRMVNTLIYGPLPDTLFSDLPMLEKLELSGNNFSGGIPQLPAEFEAYPMLQSVTISGNLPNDPMKEQLLSQPQYADNAGFQPNPQDFPGTDLTPGLDGNLPDDWNRLPLLSKIDLSGNTLSGSVPDTYSQIPLTELDLSQNAELLTVSDFLYNHLISLGYSGIKLDGILIPEPTEVPTEEPPAEEPVNEPPAEIPAEEPPAEVPAEEPPAEEPVNEPPAEIPAEEPPAEVPAEEPPAEEPINEPPAEIPAEEPPAEEPPAEEPVNEPPAEIPAEEPPAEVPAEEPPVNEPPAEIPAEEPPARVPAEEPPVNEPPAEIPAEEPPAGEPPFHVSPTEIPTEEEPVKEPPHDLPGYGMPTEVLSYDPPDDPGSVKPVEPQKTPEPIYVIVTATEEPQWVTATPIVQTQPEEPPQPYYPPANPYDPPQYAPVDPYYPYPYPVQPVPTAVPYTAPIDEPDAVRDTGASLGFTYTLTEMSRDNIPMTWQYTGMVQYSINYLDAGGNLYPAFAMEWTPAGDLCSGVVCKASVRNIPDELLKGGTFSLQLRAQDTEGRTVISDPITMQVSIPASTATPIPTPEPEHHSVFGGFLRWLFGPIIRLFGGK